MSERQRVGIAAATGRRSRAARLVRLVRYRILQIVLKLHRRFVSKDVPIGWFEYHPAAASSTDLADISARAGWYLAGLELPVRIDRVPFVLGDAPWMEPDYIIGIAKTRRVSDPGNRRHGHRLVHRVAMTALLQSLMSRSPITIVDSNLFNAADCSGYGSLQRTYRPAREQGGVGIHPRFLELIHAAQVGGRTALVVATGPSASELDLSQDRCDIRITCNSAVRNIDLLESLRPDIIAFADPVFHFGPSRYAAVFRADVRRAVALTDALLLVPVEYASLLLHHYPELASNVVPFTADASDWSWPTSSSTGVHVRATANILTMAMLPAAFAVASEIRIAGSDGRGGSERYFWRHNRELQYSDELMETVFAAHPSFFRDRMYDDYYEAHCRSLASLITFAERRGATVRAVTSSHIPALQDRGAKPPGPSGD